MKKTIHIKKTLLQVTFVITFLLIASSGYSQKTEDNKVVNREHNDTKHDNNKQHEKDSQFLVNAAEINLQQIQLGQLAQQKGNTSHVKELGKMMEEAHTKSQRDLTALANSKRITIPTSPNGDAQDNYKKLNEKSGDDFDKAYASRMVKGHNEVIKTFEKASTDSSDPEIKNWATSALPDLRKHRDHAVESHKKFADIMYFEKKEKK